MNIHHPTRFGGEPVEEGAPAEDFVLRRWAENVLPSDSEHLTHAHDMGAGLKVHAPFPFGSKGSGSVWATLQSYFQQGVGWVGKPVDHAGSDVPNAWHALFDHTPGLGWEVVGWVYPGRLKKLDAAWKTHCSGAPDFLDYLIPGATP